MQYVSLCCLTVALFGAMMGGLHHGFPYESIDDQIEGAHIPFEFILIVIGAAPFLAAIMLRGIDPPISWWLGALCIEIPVSTVWTLLAHRQGDIILYGMQLTIWDTPLPYACILGSVVCFAISCIKEGETMEALKRFGCFMLFCLVTDMLACLCLAVIALSVYLSKHPLVVMVGIFAGLVSTLASMPLTAAAFQRLKLPAPDGWFMSAYVLMLPSIFGCVALVATLTGNASLFPSQLILHENAGLLTTALVVALGFYMIGENREFNRHFASH